MRNALTFRSLMMQALATGMLAGMGGVACAQRHGVYRSAPAYAMAYGSYNRGYAQQQQPAPIERRPPPGSSGSQESAQGSQQQAPALIVRSSPPGGMARRDVVGANGHYGGEHLPEWMNQHRGMTLPQQQQALEREPGFQEQPPEVRQRMLERLAQLHAMSPIERQRWLDHTEAMERLNPMQRSVVRGALRQLGSLPPDQRQQVARSFRELRMLPPEQRMAAMNSPRYSWMNEEQRVTLANLIRIAPLLPQR